MRSLFRARRTGEGDGEDCGGATSGLPVGDDGVRVGDDAEGRALLLGVHRAAPYDVLLIGGLWTAQVLALRAGAAGVRVAVETARTQVWEGTGAASGPDEVDLFDVGRVPELGAAEGRPVLVVRDCGMRPPRGRVVRAAWQSVLTLLPYLSPVAPRLIRDSALVGVQRVSPDEAQQIGRLLGLSPEETGALPGLGDGVTLWCAGRERHWVTTKATDDEGALLGPPRRMD